MPARIACRFCRVVSLVIPLTWSVALSLAPAASGAVACGDRFLVTTTPRIWDGLACEVVVMKSQTVTLETGTFARWRPVESGAGAAALTLVHQALAGTRVEICPLTAPDIPHTEAMWLKYVNETTAALGEGTVVSELTGTSTSTMEGVHVLEWETRQARFSFTPPNGGAVVVQFHLLATEASRGVRFVVIAPAEKMDLAIDDLRLFLNGTYRPETQPSS